jgi:hypothetical protein
MFWIAGSVESALAFIAISIAFSIALILSRMSVASFVAFYMVPISCFGAFVGASTDNPVIKSGLARNSAEPSASTNGRSAESSPVPDQHQRASLVSFFLLLRFFSFAAS